MNHRELARAWAQEIRGQRILNNEERAIAIAAFRPQSPYQNFDDEDFIITKYDGLNEIVHRVYPPNLDAALQECLDRNLSIVISTDGVGRQGDYHIALTPHMRSYTSSHIGSGSLEHAIAEALILYLRAEREIDG